MAGLEAGQEAEQHPDSERASNQTRWYLQSPQAALSQWLSQLSVGRKIGSGHVIALGIATIGTIAGIVVGDRYDHHARQREEHAQEEINLLHSLQSSVLQTRTQQQQLIPLLRQPSLFDEKYRHLRQQATAAKQNWAKFKTYVQVASAEEQALHSTAHLEELPKVVNTYSDVPDRYVQELETLIQQVAPTQLRAPAQIEAAQAQLLQFTNSPLALKFDGISDAMQDLLAEAYQELEVATQAEAQASQIRAQIIAFSMMLSILVATVLAGLISRAIARPIEDLNTVAKRVTKESDFEQQAPVTTNDEIGVLAISLNQLMQRVKSLLDEQKAAAEQQLLQSEKMSSLGRMLAGVAHEINNPVNFIYGNLRHANEYIEDLFVLLHAYKAEVTHPSKILQDQEAEIDLEFLQEDLPKLLQSMQVGADRTRQIVLSLRNFSRIEETDAHPLDLHDCIDSTLLILNNRIKKDITVQQNYGNLPKIEGYAGSLYQVFMNLLSNAIDALEEKANHAGSNPAQEGASPALPLTEPPPADRPQATATLTISTQAVDAQWIQIVIADNGPGIDPENLEKIFDTFFTTKPLGVGTGLGLSISRQIVEEKHHGRLTCKSEIGIGTAFTILLPVKQPSEPGAAKELVSTV